jgi:hypothetical protein
MNEPEEPTRHSETPHAETPPAETPHAETLHSECYACPVGMLFATVHGAQPDAYEHVMNAATELIAAARSLLDAADRAIDEQRSRRAGDGAGRVRRVPVE